MKNISDILKSGGIGVLPTDTIYGLVGSALNKKTVERIYKVKRKSKEKKFIILISSLRDLKQFGIKLDKNTNKYLKQIWPNKVSVILPCLNKKFYYLHRGSNSLAFRLPTKKTLLNLIQKTGPLVAPSANLEGKPHAKTIKEAIKYFGSRVYPERGRMADFYVDGGRIIGKPSTLISIIDGRVVVLRKGSGIIKI